MTVKTILPIGTKVRFLEVYSFMVGAGLKVGDVTTVHKVASKNDGQTHLVITETGNTVWVWDMHIEEVKEEIKLVFHCDVESSDYVELEGDDTGVGVSVRENGNESAVFLTKEAAIALAETLIKLAEGVNQYE